MTTAGVALLLIAIAWLGRGWLGSRGEITQLRSEVAVLKRRLSRQNERR